LTRAAQDGINISIASGDAPVPQNLPSIACSEENTSMSDRNTSPGTSRRDFLAASATAASLAVLAPHVHAAGSDVIKVGLIGCGGRGTGAAEQALRADSNVQLTAMGDMFADRLTRSLDDLKRSEVGAKVQVKPEQQYSGFEAYKGVIASGVDVVLLATPPHFRPAHLEAAVEAGKHVFCEKPVAVDAPGVRKVLAVCAEAKKRRLSIVSGLCWRYHHAKRDTFKQIHDGALGDIVTMQCTYNSSGLWCNRKLQGMSDMEWQLRNWLYFTWLSGDHIVEQHIHSIDKGLWAMKDQPPAKVVANGGRQVRTGAEYGHIYDHFNCVFEWANGVKLFSSCRQIDNTAQEVNDHIMGTTGTCDVMNHTIRAHNGKVIWHTDPKPGDQMYQNEHDELFASVRNHKPINNGEYMSYSTMMAIMGRMAAYTGKVITWDMAMSSREDLTPPGGYVFGPLPVAPVARPGVTKFF
jgi:predicted dehydrogenase